MLQKIFFCNIENDSEDFVIRNEPGKDSVLPQKTTFGERIITEMKRSRIEVMLNIPLHPGIFHRCGEFHQSILQMHPQLLDRNVPRGHLE